MHYNVFSAMGASPKNRKLSKKQKDEHSKGVEPLIYRSVLRRQSKSVALPLGQEC